ncbi:MAG: hypothetical protein Q9226_001990 [Calogaya cf. arnoldii]
MQLRQSAGGPLNGPPNFPQAAKKVQSYRPTGSPDNESMDLEQPSTPRNPKSYGIKESINEEIVKEAQVTTVISPSKPRLVTISPRRSSPGKISTQPMTPLNTQRALISAFSPDTPPETPDVAVPSDEDARPTSHNVTEQPLVDVDAKITHPLTPPNSRIPTPFDNIDKITSSASACLQDHSCWIPPAMTQLDPLTGRILQELEVLLADFPLTALRLHSPVITRLRAATSDVSIPGASPRYHDSAAPHSRYSSYRPLSNHPMNQVHRDRSPRVADRPPAIQADLTIFALRTIFPQARAHHLDSLQATFLALHFIVNIPSSDFTVASVSDVAASPFSTSIKHSRSSSLASNIPAKARAMLGLDSPVRSSTPFASPAVSWYRASSPELDSNAKARLENVELLLETSARKILVEIQGRPLGRADDALVRAIGEVIKMGERRNGSARYGNNPIVVLKVRPKKTRFDVHKRQLCEVSPFFEAAFNGRFREKDGTMYLMEDDVHAFEHFIQWVYERDVGILLEGENKDILLARMRELFDVFILADKYVVPVLKNEIMEILFDAVTSDTATAFPCPKLPRLIDIEHVWANTARGSTLRKFVTACMVRFVDYDWYTKDRGLNWLYENPEFATDVAIGCAAVLKGDKSPFTAGHDASPFLEVVKADDGSD